MATDRGEISDPIALRSRIEAVIGEAAILRNQLAESRLEVGLLQGKLAEARDRLHGTFDLSILDTGNPDHAAILGRWTTESAVAAMPLGALTDLLAFRERLRQEIRGEWTGARLTDAELQSFGADLYRFAMLDALEGLFSRPPRDDRLVIHLVSNHPEIQSLPWEFLQEAGMPPGPRLHRQIIRVVCHVGMSAPEPLTPTPEEKVRILYVAADPLDQSAVSWNGWEEYIRHYFGKHLPDRYEFDVIEGASREALVEAVPRKKFHILHFAGHGEVDSQGVGYLVLKDRKTKLSSRVRADEICALLRDRGLRLVVLSACETAAGNFAAGYSVIARDLVRVGVPAVVANQLPLQDQSIAPFIRALYEELMRSGDIDGAVAAGRTYLYVNAPVRDRAKLDWGIPTLYRHVAGAKIFRL